MSRTKQRYLNPMHSSTQNFWPAVFAIVLGTFMAVLDTSIVNVAIPEMMNVFRVSTDEIQWVVTIYTLTMAAVIPLSGYIGVRYGMKVSYLVSLLLFTLGSLFCGFAWSNGSMIAARIVQAMGGGLMMTIGQSMIQYVVPAEKMGPAMGVFGISVFVAPAIGPSLSGYFVEYLDWRLIFTVNIPFGLLALYLVWRFLPETSAEGNHRFDLPGFVYASVFLVTILLAFTKGEQEGWSSFYIVSLFLSALVSGVLFIQRELSTSEPLVDIRLFANRDFTIGVLVNSLIMAANFSVIYLLPIYSENMLGKTAMETGLLLLPQAIASGIVTPLSGMLAPKWGVKPFIITGIALCILSGVGIAQIDLHTDMNYITWLLVLRGVGMGLCLMTSMHIPLLAITDQSRIPAGSVITNVSRQMAISIGIAGLISYFYQRGATHTVQLSETVTYKSVVTSETLRHFIQMFSSKGFSSEEAHGMSLGLMEQLVRKYATIQALQDSLAMAVIAFIVALALIFLIRERKISDAVSPKQSVPHE
ncbi:MDR family MFS transporter [Brevibacillus laterosporus]|uniref:MDR family MFS transporter n=1 Tax=Brevibacillus laterosporus TaxID=1465 RepID=UPI000B9B5D6D|nr:MDR family MFS transporter [Brevibacillus laterosporus]